MTSAALVAFSNRIATNTLTGADIAALTEALAVIAPTFQGPDETSSVVFTDETEAREWMSVLYTIAIAGGGSIVPPTFGSLIVPNSAALTAVNVTSLLNGQPAIVETFGAEFSLQPIDGMTVDGVTVLASSDVARVWERGDTVIAEQAALQTNWFVSAATGNDENDGATLVTPVKHKAEVMRRWGTWSPTLNAIHVSIVYLSADAAGSTDPGLFAPRMLNGATLTHQPNSLPAPAFTGSLLAVTVKKVTAGASHGLRSTFTTTTGALANNLMLVNTTRGNSVAFAQQNIGAGVWNLSQPLMPVAAPPGVPVPTEVDTWANGDAILGYALLSIDLAVLGGKAAEYQSTFAPSHFVYHLNLFDPGTTNFDTLSVDLTSAMGFEETCFGVGAQPGRSLSAIGPGTVIPSQFFNVALALAGFSTIQGSNGSAWTGGLFQGGAIIASGVLLQNNVIVDCASGALVDGSFFVGHVCINAGTVLSLTGPTQNTALMYGGGTVNANAYVPYVALAVNNFAQDGGLLIGDASTTAYSNVTAAGVITTHAVTLTPAHLDAAAGAAGFGGLAYIPGVGGYFNGATTPP